MADPVTAAAPARAPAGAWARDFLRSGSHAPARDPRAALWRPRRSVGARLPSLWVPRSGAGPARRPMAPPRERGRETSFALGPTLLRGTGTPPYGAPAGAWARDFLCSGSHAPAWDRHTALWRPRRSVGTRLPSLWVPRSCVGPAHCPVAPPRERGRETSFALGPPLRRGTRAPPYGAPAGAWARDFLCSGSHAPAWDRHTALWRPRRSVGTRGEAIQFRHPTGRPQPCKPLTLMPSRCGT
ncbi:hypothetical protein GGD88_000961 [Roseospira goensis]|uniref:Uncharacterized protein n=1 Tax=Roseospira goensis TaxID=391922 RepID=A0A7W6RXV9_9PROT|nr:hypothetical protein [Roseospira goensis]